MTTEDVENVEVKVEEMTEKKTQNRKKTTRKSSTSRKKDAKEMTGNDIPVDAEETEKTEKSEKKKAPKGRRTSKKVKKEEVEVQDNPVQDTSEESIADSQESGIQPVKANELQGEPDTDIQEVHVVDNQNDVSSPDDSQAKSASLEEAIVVSTEEINPVSTEETTPASSEEQPKAALSEEKQQTNPENKEKQEKRKSDQKQPVAKPIPAFSPIRIETLVDLVNAPYRQVMLNDQQLQQLTVQEAQQRFRWFEGTLAWVLNYDVVISDTNIWLELLVGHTSSHSDPKVNARLLFERQLEFISKLVRYRGGKFMMMSETFEEIDRFASQQSPTNYKDADFTDENLCRNVAARLAKRLILSQQRENRLKIEGIGAESHHAAFADPAIIRKTVELFASGKKVLLITNDASVGIRSIGMCDDLQRHNNVDDETWEEVYTPLRPMVMTMDDLKILDNYTRQYHFLQTAAGKQWMEDVPNRMEVRNVEQLMIWNEGFRSGDKHPEQQRQKNEAKQKTEAKQQNNTSQQNTQKQANAQQKQKGQKQKSDAQKNAQKNADSNVSEKKQPADASKKQNEQRENPVEDHDVTTVSVAESQMTPVDNIRKSQESMSPSELIADCNDSVQEKENNQKKRTPRRRPQRKRPQSQK